MLAERNAVIMIMGHLGIGCEAVVDMLRSCSVKKETKSVTAFRARSSPYVLHSQWKRRLSDPYQHLSVNE